MSSRVDVSRWNLFALVSRVVPVALIAACGPVLAGEESSGDDGDGDGSSTESDGTGPSSTTVSIDDTGPECGPGIDCPYGYSCIDGVCEYDCYCGCGAAPPPGSELRCSPGYECYSDLDCNDGEVCRYGYCEPDVLDCEAASVPLQGDDFELVFTGNAAPVAAIAVGELTPASGTEVIAARGDQIERFLDGLGAVVATASAPITALTTGDANGDGQADIIAGTEAEIAVWLVDGGVVAPTALVQFGAGASALALGDYDDDGEVDVFAQVDASVVLLRGQGGGQLGEPEILIAQGVRAFAVLDADGDGRTDVAWDDGADLWVLPAGGVAYNLGVSGSTSPHTVVAADFDGNGILDLASVGEDPSMITSVLGPVVKWAPYPTSIDGGTVAAAAGDVDGDGLADLAIDYGAEGRVRVMLGDQPSFGEGGPDAPFGCYGDYGVLGGAQRVILADTIGDGVADLVVSDGTSLWVTPLTK